MGWGLWIGARKAGRGENETGVAGTVNVMRGGSWKSRGELLRVWGLGAQRVFVLQRIRSMQSMVTCTLGPF